MPMQGRIGIAVAVQAKAVEPRFDSDFEIGAVAAMAMDAAVEAAAIDIVMVADQAIDGRMFAMIEVQRQHPCARQQRFTERDVGAAGDERAERERCRPAPAFRAHASCRTRVSPLPICRRGWL